MPRLTRYAKVFRDWEALLGACDRNEELLPDAVPFREELKAILQEVKDRKLLQEDLEGKRKAETQRLVEAVERGREAERKLRGFVRIRLGTKSQHLSQFGISPLGRRRRKSSGEEEQKPQTKADAESPEP